jgi:hypothetical protein
MDRVHGKKQHCETSEHILIYISNKMQHYTVYSIWKLLYMFWVIPPPIIRTANNYRCDKYQMLWIQLFALLMMGVGTARNM